MPTYEGSIATVTPTICDLFGVRPPVVCNHEPLASVREAFADQLRSSTVERCLVYCPDALGDHLWARFPQQRSVIDQQCPHRVSLHAAFPPKTPVCFASVFTGASPDVHGIRRYEKPVLTCETLFDVFIQAGLKVAIAAVRDSSIDLLFRDRAIDYFSEPYDDEVTARALTLLAEDAHDLVVVYHQEYDDQVHQTQPFSDTCVAAMHNHVGAVQTLIAAASNAWSSRTWAAVVAPDHGAHLDPDTQRGDHGADIEEDMAVSHWYAVAAPSIAGSA
jgi:hypothetical protein